MSDLDELWGMRGLVLDDVMRARINARVEQITKRLSGRIVAYRAPITEPLRGKTDLYHLRVLQGFQEPQQGRSRLISIMAVLLTTGFLVAMLRLFVIS